MAQQKIVILDRDGVLNELKVDPIAKRAVSPLQVRDVVVPSDVPTALVDLQSLGFELAIATNQPGAAKGEATRAELELVHRRVVELSEAKGARISHSYICWHRAEDLCECRKPRPGLLQQALREMKADASLSWMVGDRWIDMQAGRAAGVQTFFLQGANPFEALDDRQRSQLTLIASRLADLVNFLKR